MAVLGCSLMFLIGYLFARRPATGRYFVAGAGLAGLILVQMALGDLQYRTHLPWGLVLVHVARRRDRLGLDGRPRHPDVAAAYLD